jgi:hypothetical protein
VADDDPIQDASREISISFRQPPILKDGLPISYYRWGTAFAPDEAGYLIWDFNAAQYQGQDTIEGAIVNQGNNL